MKLILASGLLLFFRAAAVTAGWAGAGCTVPREVQVMDRAAGGDSPDLAVPRDGLCGGGCSGLINLNSVLLLQIIWCKQKWVLRSPLHLSQPLPAATMPF